MSSAHTTTTRRRPPTAAGRAALATGLPLVLFVAGGALMLSQFSKGMVEARDLRVKSRSERAFNLEEEHASAMQKLYGGTGDPSAKDLILKRIPRPDDTTTKGVPDDTK